MTSAPEESVMDVKEYFEFLEQEVKKQYELARSARKQGFDPVGDVEVSLANTLAERVVGLVSVLYPQIQDKKVIERILVLEKKHHSLDPAVALCIAEEIAKEQLCKFTSHLEAVEAGIRVALGYLTLGYVSSPIEGFIQLKVKKTANGEDFLAAYYSGPIRSAGGTEAAFSLVIVDHLREVFGYALYDPTEDEVKRGVQECYEYHERITNLQYLPSEQEIEFLMRHLPVQLTGDPSEDKEVYNYKDLVRVETNFIRSGFALVLGEGIAQKAPKVLARILALKQKGFSLSGWNWLEEFVKLQKKIKEEKQAGGGRTGATYMQDIVAGRPVFAHPSRSGAFRLRYGRARNTGYSTLAVHPATMAITHGFLALGTQMKTEKPTKGCTTAVCDSIEGPIVRLQDGSVKALRSFEEAQQAYAKTQEILYLGDLLVPYGDFLNRNHPLEKQGYIEQYWLAELEKAGGKSVLFPAFEEAVALSRQYGVALHPSLTYFWSQLSQEQFFGLVDWMGHGTVKEEVLVLPYGVRERERFVQGKRGLEIAGCEHQVTTEHVVVSKKDTLVLLFNLGLDVARAFEPQLDMMNERLVGLKELKEKTVLESVNALCSVKIKDKAGTFIGARMGRPEKAKLRELAGSPHVLFPVGEEGGRLRSVQTAIEKGGVEAEFPTFWCKKCGQEQIYPRCEVCRETCALMRYSERAERLSLEWHENGERLPEYRVKKVDIRQQLEFARRQIGLRNDEVPMVKGVRGTSNKEHSCELLAKGLLRAKHGLCVNKDGTIRYDMTEMPLTHFTPAEIGTGIEKLKGLGYERDIEGKLLEHEQQVIELFPHDIVLPACPASPDEGADKVLLSVTRFIDDELEKLYGLPRVFKRGKREELVGLLVACIAPHTASCVVGRVIGFSSVQALLASPYIHAAMRRDCDGDEAAVMLLMDLLLNFSRKFLPAHRGGTQDAPLVLNVRIRANEVDDMIFDVDVSQRIPLELYEAAGRHAHPSKVNMEQVRHRLGTEREFSELHFSYPTSNINGGMLCSSYKTLPSMQEKVDAMMKLCNKIRAVDSADVARLVIERHFIRDTRGNLRKFSMQAFRCVNCNESYRRVPLVGKCLRCGGRLLFTVSEGSILKYMQPALDLARAYAVSPYLLESLELTQMYIESIFGREREKQEVLRKWF